ncbi:glycoside hydrolase family 3 N-terminal domain-containing protein [Oerskovia sp. M15]
MINAQGLPYLDASLPADERVTDLLGRMSIEEKVGQMAQAERLGLKQASDISSLGLGSLLSGGGSVPTDNSATGWADMVDGYQREALTTRWQVPMIYGVDAVHGHNNVVGATIFPHNIGLGASRDPALVEAVGTVTATEVRATGVPWTFASCLCVTRDERWGRSYESFGEDPSLVAAFAAPSVRGLQGTTRPTWARPARCSRPRSTGSETAGRRTTSPSRAADTRSTRA